MANEKLPLLPSLTAITGQDLFYVVDVSDTTDDPTGSSKGITRDDILQNITGLTATTISATTISGTTFYGDGTNLTGVLKGAGTTNYLPKWTGTTGLGDSIIRDDGTNIGINVAPISGAKVSLYTAVNGYGLYIQNQNAAGGIGVYSFLNSGQGSQTAMFGLAQGHPTTGTSIGLLGYANDGLLGIGVKGSVGTTEFGSMATGIGGYFDGRGDGEYGYPTTSYSVQLLDGTEGVDKILQSQTSDGKSNWVDPSTIQTAFNYGISYTMLTGNYMI